MYGDSFKSLLVAVVVPHEANTERWAHENGHKGSFSELCTLSQLQDYILQELKSTAERNKVSSDTLENETVCFGYPQFQLHSLAYFI